MISDISGFEICALQNDGYSHSIILFLIVSRLKLYLEEVNVDLLVGFINVLESASLHSYFMTSLFCKILSLFIIFGITLTSRHFSRDTQAPKPCICYF